MPLQATSGAASYDAFGGGVPVSVNYIEDVFSTYLYTGNATTGQSINNGIDLATKGGLLWCKNRTTGSTPHYLFDTARDFSYSNAAVLNTASTAAQEDKGTDYAKPETNGFSFGSGAGSTSPNKSGDAFASWTFRKQPKFFDVLTYTGTGASSLTVNHNLGSTPGCIIVKNTSAGNSWWTYHRSLTNATNSYLKLNLTTAESDQGSPMWNPTSTTFDANDTNFGLNISGNVYVAYLFAHDAGGFGLTGTDNVISCGSYTGDGSNGQSVTLGYEPQWLLIKRTDTANSWFLQDNMRPFSVTATEWLQPNTSNAESTGGVAYVSPTATGFTFTSGGAAAYNASGGTYIYIAIRRGPMKVPTSGTSVFSPIAYTGNSTTNTTVQNLTTSFAGDAVIIPQRTGGNNPLFFDKLRGGTKAIYTSLTLAEETITAGESVGFNNTQTVLTGQYTAQGNYNYSGDTLVSYNFKRSPSFFDVVCYTGNGSTQTITHNLTAVPELMLIKQRSGTNGWPVYSSGTGNTKFAYLNQTSAFDTNSSAWNNTSPTSSVFTVGSGSLMNTNAQTYVAYLFATCAGVSKVGSYTGNGSSQTINCGFTGGARFVLIKKTSGTGDWMVSDSARGIVSGSDPYLELNNTNAEVTGEDWLDTDSTGFVVNEVSGSNANTNGATYIFLAIA